MDLIIPNLYLGGIETASNAESLHSHLIAAVVCCCPFTEFLATEENPDFKYFDEAHDFIHAFVQKEESVFVHCRAGVSRSATVVISFKAAKNPGVHPL
eukprot:g18953.t1